MRILFILCFICCLSSLRADEAQIRAHRAPVVRFLYEGVTVYTDTASLFHVLDSDDHHYYNCRAHALVQRSLRQSKSDTVTFIGTSIPYGDTMNTDTYTDYYPDWYPESDLLLLLKERRGVFIDAKGALVKHYKTHKEGSKATWYIKRVYTNRANHQRLFTEAVYWRTICPRF